MFNNECIWKSNNNYIYILPYFIIFQDNKSYAFQKWFKKYSYFLLLIVIVKFRKKSIEYYFEVRALSIYSFFENINIYII